MSAFFLSKVHIDLLVSAAIEWKLWAKIPGRPGFNHVDAAHADDIGRMLWRENAVSVCHRYQIDEANEDAIEYAAQVAAYRWQEWRDIDPAAVVGLIRCYDYQASEHDGWSNSDARDFTIRLLAEAAARLAKAKLGDNCPWFAVELGSADSDGYASRWATKAAT